MSVNVQMYWFLCTKLQNLSQIFSLMNYRFELPIGITDVLISTIKENTISLSNSIVLNSRYNFFSITPFSFFGGLILKSIGKTFQFEYLKRKEWKYMFQNWNANYKEQHHDRKISRTYCLNRLESCILRGPGFSWFLISQSTHKSPRLSNF